MEQRHRGGNRAGVSEENQSSGVAEVGRRRRIAGEETRED